MHLLGILRRLDFMCLFVSAFMYIFGLLSNLEMQTSVYVIAVDTVNNWAANHSKGHVSLQVSLF